MDAVPKGLMEHRGWQEGENCLQNLRVFPDVSGRSGVHGVFTCTNRVLLLGVNPLPFLCPLCPAVSYYSSSSTCPFPSKISMNRKLSLPFDVQPPSLSEMTEGCDVFSCSSHPLSPWPGVQRDFAAHEQGWKCLTSHIIPTSFPHLSHNEYTPVNTPPWPHTQKCGYFLYLMLETPHHAHPKHTCNTNMCTFSATRPTTEWKSTAKHRMEKNAWSNTQHGLRVMTEKLASVKGGKKEPIALRKVYSH